MLFTNMYCCDFNVGDVKNKRAKPIVELITWQMYSERCALLGNMLTSSAAFHRWQSSSFAYMEPFSSEPACLR